MALEGQESIETALLEGREHLAFCFSVVSKNINPRKTERCPSFSWELANNEIQHFFGFPSCALPNKPFQFPQGTNGYTNNHSI